MGEVNDLRPERCRQLVEKVLLVFLGVRELAIALEVLLDLVVKRPRHVCALGKLIEGCYLLIKDFLTNFNACNDLRQVSYSKRVETDPRKHPNDSKYFFRNCLGVYISEAHWGECLKGPVDRSKVLERVRIIHIVLSDNPCVWVKAIKFCLQEPEATH